MVVESNRPVPIGTLTPEEADFLAQVKSAGNQHLLSLGRLFYQAMLTKDELRGVEEAGTQAMRGIGNRLGLAENQQFFILDDQTIHLVVPKP